MKNTPCVVLLCIAAAILVSMPTAAQLRGRTASDSARISKNGHWYYSNCPQGETAFPKQTSMPPLSLGMPITQIFQYIYIDSLCRTTTTSNLHDMYFKRWKLSGTSNDTLKQLVTAYNQLKDYDPVKLFQYNWNMGATYITTPLRIHSQLLSTLESIRTPSRIPRRFVDYFSMDYLLNLTITQIDTLERRDYITGSVIPKAKLYKVYATVHDTLYGKVFGAVFPSGNLSDAKRDQVKDVTPQIVFVYINMPYDDDNALFHSDTSLVGSDGNLALHSGQQLAVSLRYLNVKLDASYDYLQLALINAYPIANGNVLDSGHYWSQSNQITIAQWKAIFSNDMSTFNAGGY